MKFEAADTLGDKNCEAEASLSPRGTDWDNAGVPDADIEDGLPVSIWARSFCRADICSAKMEEDWCTVDAVGGNGSVLRTAGAIGAAGGSS